MSQATKKGIKIVSRNGSDSNGNGFWGNIKKLGSNGSIVTQLREEEHILKDLKTDSPAGSRLSSLISQNKTNLDPIFHPKKQRFPKLGSAVFILGWLVAASFAFFFAREYLAKQDTLLILAETEGAKTQLEQTAMELRERSMSQTSEIRRLNEEIVSVTGDLRAANQKAAVFDAMENTYRAELSYMKSFYERQIDSFKSLIREKDGFVKMLENHLEAIKRIVGKGTLAAGVGSVSARSVSDISLGTSESILGDVSELEYAGEIAMTNIEYQFFIVHGGLDKGAEVGRMVALYRDGEELGQGVIDRVYPAFSAITIINEDVLRSLQTGETLTIVGI